MEARLGAAAAAERLSEPRPDAVVVELLTSRANWRALAAAEVRRSGRLGEPRGSGTVLRASAAALRDCGGGGLVRQQRPSCRVRPRCRVRMRLLPSLWGPGRRCPLFWSMGQPRLRCPPDPRLSGGDFKLPTSPSASAPAPCAGCAAARSTAARGAAPTGGRGRRLSRAEARGSHIFIRGGGRLPVRGRGLRTGRGAAQLVGGGGVAGGVVSATTGGCHVLLAARRDWFFAVGHDGVGDAVFLARDRPRSV